MNSEDYQYIFKFSLFGDSGVGKSCFLSQYTKGTFVLEYNSTIGLEFESKSIELTEGVVIQNQMWDASGNQKFVNIQISLCKNSTAALFFYKINSRPSFQSLAGWIKQLKDVCSDEFQIVIIGTHKDLENQREVPTDEAKRFADHYNAKFYEISNQDKDQIDGIVNALTFNILRMINSGKINPLDQKYGIKLSRQQEMLLNQKQEEQQQQQQSPPRRLSDRVTNLSSSSPPTYTQPSPIKQSQNGSQSVQSSSSAKQDGDSTPTTCIIIFAFLAVGAFIFFIATKK